MRLRTLLFRRRVETWVQMHEYSWHRQSQLPQLDFLKTTTKSKSFLERPTTSPILASLKLREPFHNSRRAVRRWTISSNDLNNSNIWLLITMDCWVCPQFTTISTNSSWLQGLSYLILWTAGWRSINHQCNLHRWLLWLSNKWLVMRTIKITWLSIPSLHPSSKELWLRPIQEPIARPSWPSRLPSWALSSNFTQTLTTLVKPTTKVIHRKMPACASLTASKNSHPNISKIINLIRENRMSVEVVKEIPLQFQCTVNINQLWMKRVVNFRLKMVLQNLLPIAKIKNSLFLKQKDKH